MTRVPGQHADPAPLPLATAVVIVRCAPRPGQEFGDVHVVRRVAASRVLAVTAAADAATKLAHDRSPGAPFRLTATTHR